MNPSDDVILEILSDADLILSPAVIAINSDYSRHEVNRRLSNLADVGLVTRVKRGYYEISDQGEAYLAGELDATELDDPDGADE